MHELSHYKRKDMITNYLLLIMTAIHWFNPFVYSFFKKMRQEMELATDEIALSKMDKGAKKKYGLTLISLLQSYETQRIEAKMLCVTDDSKNMERRIKRIKNFGKSTHKKIIAGLACIVMAVFVLPFIVEANGVKNISKAKTNPKIMLEEVMNNKRTFITENNEEKLFNAYELANGEYARPDSYVYIDLDDDGIQELVILTTANYGAYIILHLEEENIYGYELGIRLFEELKANGTFMSSSGANFNEYYMIEFNKNTYNFAIVDEEVFDKEEKVVFNKYINKEDDNKNIYIIAKENVNIMGEEIQDNKENIANIIDGIITNSKEEKSQTNVENNEYNLVGRWKPYMAEQNGKEVSLREIYGSGIGTYGGELIIEDDGTFSEFIGIYSKDDIDNLIGKYEVYGNGEKALLTTNNEETKLLEFLKENKDIILMHLKDKTCIYFFRET